MLESLQQIENLSSQLHIWVFAALGVFIVLIGLIVWLAGLRQSRLLAAIAGAIAGLIAGMTFAKAKGPTAIAITTTSGALLGLFLDKFVIVIVGALIVVVAGLLVATGAHIEVTGNQSHAQTGNDALGLGQILQTTTDIISAYANQVCVAIKDASAGALAASGFAGLVVVGVGFFWARFVAAAVYASVGTSLIFVGMVIVLLFKGSDPITRISEQANIYGIAAGCMVIFGTSMQMVLCPAKRKEKHKTENTDGEE